MWILQITFKNEEIMRMDTNFWLQEVSRRKYSKMLRLCRNLLKMSMKQCSSIQMFILQCIGQRCRWTHESRAYSSILWKWQWQNLICLHLEWMQTNIFIFKQSVTVSLWWNVRFAKKLVKGKKVLIVTWKTCIWLNMSHAQHVSIHLQVSEVSKTSGTLKSLNFNNRSSSSSKNRIHLIYIIPIVFHLCKHIS